MLRRKRKRRTTAPTLGVRIVSRLTEFAEALERNEPLEDRFTHRRVTLDLRPTTHSPSLVRSTREVLKASQALFAQFLGVSVKTVRAWEQGLATPSDLAARFMDEIHRDPAYWSQRFCAVLVTKIARNGR